MAGLRRHLPWSLVPAILWVCLHALMAAGLVGAPTDRAVASDAPWGETTVVICATHGPLQISLADLLGEAQAPEDNPDKAPADNACPWCQAFAQIDMPRPSGLPEPARPDGMVQGAWLSALEVAYGFRAADAFESRAPPV